MSKLATARLETCNPATWGSRRLWSLWDMLKLNAAAFHAVMTDLQRFQVLIENVSDQIPSDVPISDQHRPNIKDLAERLKIELNILQTQAAWICLDRLIIAIDNKDFTYEMLAKAVNDVSSRLTDELTLKSVYVLDDSKIKYFEDAAKQFGQDVLSKFSSSSYEIDEAGKCIAVHRGTAAVFHLMRTMEIGIQAARKCLQIPDPIKDAERNWGAILRKFKDELDRRNRSNPIMWNGNDKAFFEEVYASLDAVRNVWRNATMHVETKYTIEEAEHIFGAVRGFMKKLSARMDEAGTPLA